ncbi:hypothetical protein NDK50_27030 [Paraburkholderia bryophila]|nr:hypothetical protein [Paraburkholderia bryophila]WCM24465.1 hypothetical protein NDK50_27030 [Paraburkholderia bryophila]
MKPAGRNQRIVNIVRSQAAARLIQPYLPSGSAPEYALNVLDRADRHSWY